MNTKFTIRNFCNRVHQLIEEVSITHRPITIIGKRHNAVLLSEDDWNALKETLASASIPGMQKSIKKGLATPLDECSSDLEK